MKVFKNIHLISVLTIPMHQITSAYYTRLRRESKTEFLRFGQEEEFRQALVHFEEGYRAALLDGGVKLKDHPHGKRES